MDFTDTERQKERNKEHKEKLINMILSTLEQNLNRQSYYKDPVTVNCIFLEKLLTISDMAGGFILAMNENITEEQQERMRKITQTLDKNIKSLIDMIQHPCFSPDHPYGKNLMTVAENDFNGIIDDK